MSFARGHRLLGRTANFAKDPADAICYANDSAADAIINAEQVYDSSRE